MTCDVPFRGSGEQWDPQRQPAQVIPVILQRITAPFGLEDPACLSEEFKSGASV